MSVGKIRVLVVDDDFMIARLHARCVEQEPGFELAGLAHTCKQALAATRQLQPDLIVLDVYLPDRPGLEVARALRAAALPCDFILITAAREKAVAAEEQPSSADRIAQRAGVSRSTARAYLNHLVRQGAAEELLQYGSVGRPQVRFRARR